MKYFMVISMNSKCNPERKERDLFFYLEIICSFSLKEILFRFNRDPLRMKFLRGLIMLVFRVKFHIKKNWEFSPNSDGISNVF